MVKLVFAVLLMVSLGLLAYPMTVIQPFRHQGETELQVALWIIRWRPYFEALAVVLAISTLVGTWIKRSRLLPRSASLLAALIVCAAAALTRINVFELMFHRYDRPAFTQAIEAKIEPDDKVLTIAVNHQARAYPIRTIAYHHIINDEVGGIPVVATY